MPTYIATHALPDPMGDIATQHFAARVNDVALLELDDPMTLTEFGPFTVDAGPQGGPGVDVSLSLNYVDQAGNVGAPRTQVFHVDAPPVPPDTIPPDAPGDFGEIKLVSP